MRLTSFQQQTICNKARHYFGNMTQVWLFGSRVDDSKRGGDIDLYIELENQDISLIAMAKLRFLRSLHSELGEQKLMSYSVWQIPTHLPFMTSLKRRVFNYNELDD
jgi:predicted nucleotidyltransferase